jgi:hypothetical protein
MCNCIKEIEKKIEEQAKENDDPKFKGKGSRVDSVKLVNKILLLNPYVTTKMGTFAEIKIQTAKGTVKVFKELIIYEFCPFCGTKYQS